MTGPRPSGSLDRFHRHLDVCVQCRNNPMTLCPAGAIYLSEAGREAAEELNKTARLVLGLAVLLFAFLLPTVSHAFRKAPAGLEAAALAAASHAPLPVRGDARATRDLLLAIAEHESAFRIPIIRCKITGDNGRAFGAYQLHREAFGDHTPEEVCASDSLQAKLALGVLHRHLAVFPDLGIRGAVRGYASGFPTKDTKASREILMMWRARRAK